MLENVAATQHELLIFWRLFRTVFLRCKCLNLRYLFNDALSVFMDLFVHEIDFQDYSLLLLIERQLLLIVFLYRYFRISLGFEGELVRE